MIWKKIMSKSRGVRWPPLPLPGGTHADWEWDIAAEVGAHGQNYNNSTSYWPKAPTSCPLPPANHRPPNLLTCWAGWVTVWSHAVAPAGDGQVPAAAAASVGGRSRRGEWAAAAGGRRSGRRTCAAGRRRHCRAGRRRAPEYARPSPTRSWAETEIWRHSKRRTICWSLAVGSSHIDR